MVDDIEQKLKQDIDIYECVIFQLVELADVCYVSLLLLLIRTVFIYGNIRVSRSCWHQFHYMVNSRGENIFQSFHGSPLQMNIPIHKLLSIIAYGAAVVTNESVGLIGL